jgi:hypothetical protein
MSNIINKSNHPVEVKKINIRVWKLRDEIEKAIAKRIEENGGSAEGIDIEDIRAYYTRSKPKYLDPNYDPDDDDDNVVPIGADGVDSSGNEMDDDAMAMMAALQGGDEEGGEEGDDSESEESEASDEDDEAAKLAAEMLGDQGGNADDEAAKLAAEMLGDQGNESSSNSSDSTLTRAIPDGDKLSSGFSLLSDMNMENIVFFSQQGYTFGQNIALQFLIPNRFIISAEVTSCLNMNRRSKIISKTKPNFRVEATITYLWEGERTNLRDFLKSVEPDIPPPPKKMKRIDTEDEDDDEFEDLGF